MISTILCIWFIGLILIWPGLSYFMNKELKPGFCKAMLAGFILAVVWPWYVVLLVLTRLTKSA